MMREREGIINKKDLLCLDENSHSWERDSISKKDGVGKICGAFNLKNVAAENKYLMVWNWKIISTVLV